jgi:transposase
MSLKPDPIGPIPDDTARIARAAFPKGNVYMQMRDVFGAIYDDTFFAPLFAVRGRPAETPWRLALVTVMQFAEGLPDRQAAEAVRARIDWKYALGLDLTDAGFDFSVLSEFRARLVGGGAEHLLLDVLLTQCTQRGYLKARGQQRTDATHVLGALRVLSRLECVSETLRCALNAVALAAPDWLRERAPADWFARYSRRIEEYRLPKGKEARQAYGETVGADGIALLSALFAPTAPAALRLLPAVDLLRRTWLAQYVMLDGQVRLRDPKQMPVAALRIDTPHEPEARYCEKRGLGWTGYKVHLSESCDDELPHLLTRVETTVATETDVAHLAVIHEGLARVGLLPARHLVDAGYIRARNLVESRADYDIDLFGPTYEDRQWQARAGTGYDVDHFRIDWDAGVVTCPQGRQSVRWFPMQTARGRSMIHVAFAPADCLTCSARAQCTRAKSQPRNLTLLSREEHEAMRVARQRQETAAFAAQYARRQGIEGTLSQGVRACGLRRARYRGRAKTHLQHVATAVAVNVRRMIDWLNGVPRAQTRCSHFAALALAS